MYFMSDPQALHVTRNVIPGKLGVDLHLHRVHIPLVLGFWSPAPIPNSKGNPFSEAAKYKLVRKIFTARQSVDTWIYWRAGGKTVILCTFLHAVHAEARLKMTISLTNRATRLEVSRGHQTNRSQLGLRPRPRWGSLQKPQPQTHLSSSLLLPIATCQASQFPRWRPASLVRRLHCWWPVPVTSNWKRPRPWSSGHRCGVAVVPPLSWT